MAKHNPHGILVCVLPGLGPAPKEHPRYPVPDRECAALGGLAAKITVSFVEEFSTAKGELMVWATAPVKRGRPRQRASTLRR